MRRIILTILLLGVALNLTNAQQPARRNDEIESFALELIVSPAPRRDELLTARTGLITVELRKELVRHGNNNFANGRYGKALEIYQLVEKLSDQIDDKEGLATAAFHR